MIAKETPLIPELIAETFSSDPEMIEILCQRAEHLYQINQRFRDQIQGEGNKGRDYLYMMMHHWHQAILKWGKEKYKELMNITC